MLTRTSTILIEGLKDPENRACWEAFDARYRPLILAVARRLGLQDADAEDAAQDTIAAFIQGYRRGDYQRGKGRLRDWLCGIAGNKARDVFRRGGREKLIADKTDGTLFFSKVEDAKLQQAWEDEWNQAVLRQCLAQVREELPARSYEAFQLFALEQLPAREVARRLQVSEDFVYQVKHRVLARIRELALVVDADC